MKKKRFAFAFALLVSMLIASAAVLASTSERVTYVPQPNIAECVHDGCCDYDNQTITSTELEEFLAAFHFSDVDTVTNELRTLVNEKRANVDRIVNAFVLAHGLERIDPDKTLNTSLNAMENDDIMSWGDMSPLP